MTGASTQNRRPGSTGSFEGTDSVEIKITVPADQELSTERSLKLDEHSAGVREVYFYDTLRLDLFNKGLALRARRSQGAVDDSTVKFRPIRSSGVSKGWRRVDGFKLEADWIGDRVVCSASLTSKQDRNEILDVASGGRRIDKLFSADQERFLTEFFNKGVDLSALRVLGPTHVLYWKLEHQSFDQPLCVEEWRLPNGADLVEISIRVPPSSAHRAQKAFHASLRAIGVNPDGVQQTKTRTALEYFADALREKEPRDAGSGTVWAARSPY